MKCPNCKMRVERTDNYCSYCGRALKEKEGIYVRPVCECPLDISAGAKKDTAISFAERLKEILQSPNSPRNIL